MKKILLLLALLFLVTLAFAQHPIGTDSLQLQTLGSAKTFVKSKNLIGSDSGSVNAHYPDTATANLYKVSKYPGGQIMVGDTVWVRNITATAWLLMGSGGGAGPVPNLQLVTDVGYTTTNPLISYNSVAVIGADTIDNLSSVSSPTKGVISLNINTGANPAVTWNLAWNSGVTNLFADSADGKNLQLPNANGFLAHSVNGIAADVFGNIVDTSHRTDTAFIINTIHDSLVLRGPDTTTLIFPLYAINDSTFAIKRDSLPRFDYNLANYDTTTWLPLTLITKQYFEDRIGGLTGGGGGETLDRTLDIGNITNKEIIFSDSTATATHSGKNFIYIRPENYLTNYGTNIGTQGSFHSGYGYYPGVNADGRPNVVYLLGGYNGGFGSPVIAGEPAMGVRFESHFQIGAAKFIESHGITPEIYTRNGQIRRLGSVYTDDSTGASSYALKMDQTVFYQGNTDTVNLAMSAGNIEIGLNTNGHMVFTNKRKPQNLYDIALVDGGTNLVANSLDTLNTKFTISEPITVIPSPIFGTNQNGVIQTNVTLANHSGLNIQNSAGGSADIKGIYALPATTGTFMALESLNLSAGTNIARIGGNGGTMAYQLYDYSAGRIWNMSYLSSANDYSFRIGLETDSNIIVNGSTGNTKIKYNLGIGTATPTARIMIPASTASANTGQLKFVTGTLPTTPEIGLMNMSNGLWFLDSSNTIRDTIATRRWARNNITGSSGGGGTVTSVSGTTNRITSTGGTTPAIDISGSYVGQTSLTTLGTVTTGTLSTGAVIGGVTMTLGSDAQGDIYYRNGSGILTRLAAGTANQVLHSGTTPVWKDTTASGAGYTFSTGLTNTSSTITNNLSTGVSGGQSVVGGTASENNLTLSSTTNGTKGKILFGTSAYDEVNNSLGIGTTTSGGTDLLNIVGSNAGRISITMQNTNSAGNTSYYFQNNRGSFNSYGGLAQWGSTASSTWMGATRADKTALIADGTNSTGMIIGTLTAQALTLGTNNAQVMTLDASQRVGVNVTSPTSALHTTSFATRYIEQTANYSVLATDHTVCCTANSFTVTLPTAVGITGRIYIIKNIGAGTITIATTSSQTIDGAAPGTVVAGAVTQLQSTGGGWIKIN